MYAPQTTVVTRMVCRVGADGSKIQFSSVPECYYIVVVCLSTRSRMAAQQSRVATPDTATRASRRNWREIFARARDLRWVVARRSRRRRRRQRLDLVAEERINECAVDGAQDVLQPWLALVLQL